MTFINFILFAAVIIITFAAARQALFFKREPRSALAWVVFILALPPFGALVFYLFGVNRVRTRARALKPATHTAGAEQPVGTDPLDRLGHAVTGHPRRAGNGVEALFDGESAFPAMLADIEGARQRILLSTYIFDADEAGTAFIDALSSAVARGVDVRVMIDGIGELYSLPRRAVPRLRAVGVRAERFLPPRLWPPRFRINLRNHRKLLIVDDRIAFTGGMNISERHCSAGPRRGRVHDIQFRLKGPVVRDLTEAFAEDWRVVTGEVITPAILPTETGQVTCRMVLDGPNEDLDRLPLMLVGAIGIACERIAIMTPYFLPPRELIVALQAAALRGVRVDLILPAKNNLPYVDWAMRNMLWELLERDIGVHYQPGSFVHSKLFLVDSDYAQIGSANLDSRSLRLNFELVVEVLDEECIGGLYEHFDTALARSQRLTLADVDGRPWPIRLRDGLAWLFTPYL
ncbi:phospholipase D-like domain-containing protein [Thiohalomonas denitrificans]|uniref:Cardiolipin synthase n=1 Tax=Thiohalomonas denitrificans TaxID=415747 RepID=A0A1G5PUZ4_9GAMM|nr:phospholipase D-like domain-containing protein [Thiohalomonas denitrificans]SCZ52859.1 cardiolipin synthase [Thiohalomonas denitrificans]